MASNRSSSIPPPPPHPQSPQTQTQTQAHPSILRLFATLVHRLCPVTQHPEDAHTAHLWRTHMDAWTEVSSSSSSFLSSLFSTSPGPSPITPSTAPVAEVRPPQSLTMPMWVRHFGTLLEASIRSEIKSINHASTAPPQHDTRKILAIDNDAFLCALRLHGAACRDTANALESCLHRLLHRLPLCADHPSSSSSSSSLSPRSQPQWVRKTKHVERSPPFVVNTRFDTHTLASVLLLLQALAELPTTTTTTPPPESHAVSTQVFPSLILHGNSNHKPIASPPIASTPPIPPDVFVPYTLLAKNPSLHHDLLRDPWRVLYAETDFHLPTTTTTATTTVQSPFPSMQLLPRAAHPPSGGTPTYTHTRSGGVPPLYAPLALPALDPLLHTHTRTTTFPDWISIPSTPSSVVTPTPLPSRHTASSHGDLDSGVHTARATEASGSPTSLRRRSSSCLSMMEQGKIDPNFLFLNNLHESDQNEPNCGKSLLTWDTVTFPTVACFGPPSAAHKTPLPRTHPTVHTKTTITHPRTFDALYAYLTHDLLNPAPPSLPYTTFRDHALQTLAGLASPTFAWSDPDREFHPRVTPLVVHGHAAMTVAHCSRQICETATALRALETHARALRDHRDTCATARAAAAAAANSVHALREELHTRFRGAHVGPRMLVQALRPYARAVEGILHALRPPDPPLTPNTRAHTGLGLLDHLQACLLATDGDYGLAPSSSVHVDDPGDPARPAHTHLRACFTAALQPALHWLAAWVRTRDLGTHDGCARERVDPHHEFWVRWRGPLAFAAPDTFWASGYVPHPAEASGCSAGVEDACTSRHVFAPCVQARVARIQKWHAVVATEHPAHRDAGVFAWLADLAFPHTWAQMHTMARTLAARSAAVAASLAASPVPLLLLTTTSAAAPPGADLAARMAAASAARQSAWAAQRAARVRAESARKRARQRDVRAFLADRAAEQSARASAARVDGAERVQQVLAARGRWAQAVAAERKALMAEHGAWDARLEREGARVAWRRARLALRHARGRHGERHGESVMASAPRLLEGPANVRTSLHGADKGEDDDGASSAFSNQGEEEAVDEAGNVDMDIDAAPDPSSSSTSEVSNSDDDDDDGAMSLDAETHPADDRIPLEQSTPLPDVALPPPTLPPSPPYPASCETPHADPVRSATGASAVVTAPPAALAYPAWPCSPPVSKTGLFPGILASAASAPSSPSPATAVSADSTSSPVGTQPTPASGEEAPFALALDYFQSWLHQHLRLTESQLIHAYLAAAPPTRYLAWLHGYFLMQDAGFRDRLCDVLFARTRQLLTVVASSAQKGAGEDADPHVLLATQLNTLLAHEPSLSFKISRENVPTMPQDLGLCDFLSLDLHLDLPHAVFLTHQHIAQYQSIFRFLLILLATRALLVRLPVSHVRFQALSLTTALFTGLSRAFPSAPPGSAQAQPEVHWRRLQAWHTAHLDTLALCVDYARDLTRSVFRIVAQLGTRPSEATQVALGERFAILMKVFLDNMPSSVKKKIGGTWMSHGASCAV